MCIIAAVPEKKRLNKEYFENCAENNPDGFGMMWVEDHKVKVYNTMDKDDLWSKYFTVSNQIGDITPIILHFRIGTSGGNNLENSHPFFIIENEIAFCHNGVLSTGSTKTMSDTRVYNEKYLKSLGEDIYEFPVIQELIEDHIGASNKFVFLNSYKEIIILNEKAGTVKDDIWFSNSGYSYSRSHWAHNYVKGKDVKKNKEVIPNLLCTSCGGDVEKDSSVGILYKGKWIYVCEGCATETGVIDVVEAWMSEPV